MTWVFAILIVLTLGGIAAVAVGRGAPMTETDVDRPDTLVPETGPVTAHDLREVRFPLVLRGYRMADVDALLDRLAAQLDEPSRDAAYRPRDQPSEDPTDQDRADQGRADEDWT